MSIFLRRSCSSRFRSQFCNPAINLLVASGIVEKVLRTQLSTSRSASGTPRRRTSQVAEKKYPNAELRKNILEETKIQDYLEHIASSSQEVTIADVERYRPSKHASPRSSEYEDQYNALVEILVRSFSQDQLRKFLAMYHLNAPLKRTKWEMASSIIERQWNWPSLEVIQKEKRDWTETVQDSFPLDTRQSFLILGKDGGHLLDLSSEFNTHVSFSANPLCLKVEGLRGSLGNLRRHIEDFKVGIKEEFFQLPPGRTTTAGSLQRISRLSGVFTEDMGKGLIRFSYRNGDNGSTHFAKRLALQNALEVRERKTTLIYSAHEGALTTTRPKTKLQATYSLYPFFSSQSASRANTGSLFRIRRIRDWLNLHRGGLENTFGIAGNGDTMDINRVPVDLRNLLLDQLAGLQDEGSPKAHITASLGHLLVCSGVSQNINPPLKGAVKLPNMLEWLQRYTGDRIFVPSLPPLLFNKTLMHQRLIHRLIYHSYTHDETIYARAPKVIQFELVHGLHGHMPSAPEDGGKLSLDPLINRPGGSYPVDENIPLESKCWVESTSNSYVMMPDRAMDIRLSVSTSHILSKKAWPKTIESYSRELQSFLTNSISEPRLPAAPLVFTHEDIQYRLESSSTARQSSGPLSYADSTLKLRPEASIETTLEQESKHRSRVCKILCADIESDDSWASFIDACNALSLAVYSKSVRGRISDGERSLI